ncbi:MAG TPA: transcriptional regulator, partial [Pyrinomonadaceae bacterium]|nr:transcriptional regulator [Pyrinomonadaceae bacterium]
MKAEKRHSYRFKAFRLEVEERQLLHHDQPVPLTPKAFDVLVALVERSGHLVEKEELLHIVWSDSFVEEANIARIIHTLRKTLGEDEHGVKFIETVAKKGYRFVAKVSKIREPDYLGIKTGNQYLSSLTEELPQTAFSSNDKPKHQNGTPVNPPLPLAERKTSRRWILIAVMLCAIALVLGTRFSLFNLFESGGQNFYSIEMSRLSEKSGIYGGDISPDGRFVAFVEQKEGRGTLFVKQILTGVTITIVPPIL